jgi:hypothetical protein
MSRKTVAFKRKLDQLTRKGVDRSVAIATLTPNSTVLGTGRKRYMKDGKPTGGQSGSVVTKARRKPAIKL